MPNASVHARLSTAPGHKQMSNNSQNIRKILICGSRDWTDVSAIQKRVAQLDPTQPLIVIHGGAQGADTIAGKACHEEGIHTACVRALWSHFDKRAGHIRNQVMIDLQPDLVIAFTTGSPGTAGTIELAERRGIEVEVHRR